MKKAGQNKETLKIENIGLDDGYANIKLAWKDEDGTIRTQKVPSRAKAGSLGVGSLLDDGPGAAMGYETEGERWTVAPGIEGESTRFPDYNLSSLARVLAHHALVSAGWGGKDVGIATGLPLDRYFRDGKRDDVRIARKIENFSKDVIRLDGGATARIVGHEVFAQGLAAVVDWLVDDSDPREQIGPIGVVDIGGQTTDISVVSPGFQIDRGRVRTVDLGVLDVRDLLRRRLQSRFDVYEISDGAIDAALAFGKIRVWNKEVDVIDDTAQVVREVESSLERNILSEFGKAASSFETILFVGGGSRIFRSLPARFPNAVVGPDPEFANARGLLKIRILNERLNKRGSRA